MLPRKLPGTVHRQFVRCGKSRCKCVSGRLHGPYYFYFVRINGKLKKQSIAGCAVELIQKACRTRQLEAKAEKSMSLDAWDRLRRIRQTLREHTGSGSK